MEKETYKEELSEYVRRYNESLAECMAKLGSLYILNEGDISINYLEDQESKLSILSGDLIGPIHVHGTLTKEYTEFINKTFKEGYWNDLQACSIGAGVRRYGRW